MKNANLPVLAIGILFIVAGLYIFWKGYLWNLYLGDAEITIGPAMLMMGMYLALLSYRNLRQEKTEFNLPVLVSGIALVLAGLDIYSKGFMWDLYLGDAKTILGSAMSIVGASLMLLSYVTSNQSNK